MNDLTYKTGMADGFLAAAEATAEVRRNMADISDPETLKAMVRSLESSFRKMAAGDDGNGDADGNLF